MFPRNVDYSVLLAGSPERPFMQKSICLENARRREDEITLPVKLEVMPPIRLADADGTTEAAGDIELLLNNVLVNAELLAELFGTPCTQYLFSVSTMSLPWPSFLFITTYA